MKALETCLICMGRGVLRIVARCRWTGAIVVYEPPCGRCCGAGRVVSN